MKILIVLANPNAQSFTHAIAERCLSKIEDMGHTPIMHDLYAEGFDPVIESKEIPKKGEYPKIIEQHCNHLLDADGIVVIHPNWWGMPPAIMKGWIDRVFRPGLVYEFIDGDQGEGVPVGKLKAKAALVFNTSNTSPEREEQVFKDPLETIWKNCVFDLCGVEKFYRRMFRIMVTSGESQRQAWLDEAAQAIEEYFPKKA